MIQPYTGRAIIQDHFTELIITIPTKKNWLAIFPVAIWLAFWGMAEVFAISALFNQFTFFPGLIFFLIWITFWTFGGVMAFKSLLWNLIGKEIITVDQVSLTIDKKGALLFKKRMYDINQVKSIRVQEDDTSNDGFFSRRRTDFGFAAYEGTIRFDYGLKTIKFAVEIDEAEAKFIIEELKNRNLLTAKNFD
jgi:hypothetical protein